MQEDNVGPQWAALKPLEKDHSISIGPLQEFLQSDKLKNVSQLWRESPCAFGMYQLIIILFILAH